MFISTFTFYIFSTNNTPLCPLYYIDLNGELEVEADILGHEPHQAARQADAAVPRRPVEHPDLPGLYVLAAEDAGEQRGLTAPTRAKKGEDCPPFYTHRELAEDGGFTISHHHLIHDYSVRVHVERRRLQKNSE